jgi:hypothetical protein
MDVLWYNAGASFHRLPQSTILIEQDSVSLECYTVIRTVSPRHDQKDTVSASLVSVGRMAYKTCVKPIVGAGAHHPY